MRRSASRSPWRCHWPEAVVDQQLQTLALNRRQYLRHHFIDQILNGEQRGWFSSIAFQHIRQLNLIHQFDQLIGMLASWWLSV
jgi:hypothetical protein